MIFKCGRGMRDPLMDVKMDADPYVPGKRMFATHRLFLLILSVFFCPMACSESPRDHGDPLRPRIEILKDPTRSLNIDQISKSTDFALADRTIVGFEPVDLWVRLNVHNPADVPQEFIFEDQWALTDHIDIHVPRSTGGRDTYRIGHRDPPGPFSSRHRFPAAAVQLDPGTTQIHIRYRSNDILGSRLAIWVRPDFDRHRTITMVAFGLLSGAILIMSLYNFFLYLVLRYKAYFFYFSYSFSFFLFQLCISGLLGLFTGEYGWWNDQGTIVFAGLALIFVVYFARSFLSLPQKAPRLSKLGNVIQLLALTSMTLLFFDFSMSALVAVSANICIAAWIICCSLNTSLRRDPEGLIFLAAWGLFVIGDVASISYYMGYAEPSVFSQWGMITGSALEVALLSFGLANHVNRMKRGMQDAKEALNQELSRSLEKVEAQVQEKTRDIRLILQTIQQGIFTVYKPQLMIHEEHSSALLSILGQDRVAGKSLSETFLKASHLGSDQLSLVEGILNASLGEDILSFEMNSHSLPREIQYQRAPGETRTLSLYWEPMLDRNNKVERILITVRDVTEELHLQAQAAAQSLEITIVGEIAQRDLRHMGLFLRTARQFMAGAHAVLDRDVAIDEQNKEIYRILHTLKGNARAMDLPRLASIIHETESILAQTRQNPLHPGFTHRDLAAIEAELDPYLKVFGKYFQAFWETDKVMISRAAAKALVLRLHRDGSTLDDAVMYELTSVTLGLLDDLVQRLQKEAGRLARDLGKPEPILVLGVKGLFVNPEFQEVLVHILGHLLRNSLDHGLEMEAERVRAGKSPQGRILIGFGTTDEPYLSWQDDGCGLDLEAIAGTARARGMSLEPGGFLSPEICAATIFHSGFSTRQESSLISGRGVGLDAVVSLIRDHGGRVELHYIGSPTPRRFQPFELRMFLPQELILAFAAQTPEFAIRLPA